MTETQPTAAAMRAAEDLAYLFARPDMPLGEAARIIDRETGLPGLIAACENLLRGCNCESVRAVCGPAEKCDECKALAALAAAKEGPK